MSHGNILLQHATPTTDDEISATISDSFFEQASRNRAAHTGMIKSEPLALVFDFVDAVRAVFPANIDNHACIGFSNHLFQHLVEEANYAGFGYIPRTDLLRGLNFGNEGGVEFEDGISHRFIFLQQT